MLRVRIQLAKLYDTFAVILPQSFRNAKHFLYHVVCILISTQSPYPPRDEK